MGTETTTRREIYDLKSYDPQRSIGGLLGRVKIAMGAAVDAELAPLDITAAQYVILMSIALKEADSASELCKGISYDAGAMTRMIDRLESKGLIHRNRRPDDRRVVYIELTEEGRRAFPRMKVISMSVVNQFLRGFSQAEARQLEGFLSRMLENAA